MRPRPFRVQRPLAAVAACYGVGIGAGVFLPWYPALYGAALALSLIYWLLLRRRGRGAAGGMTAFFFLGLLLAGLAAHPVTPAPGKYQITGVLSADATLREDGTAFGFLERAVLENEEGVCWQGRLYWTYTPDAEAPLLPREGDAVAFQGKVYLPAGRQNPYGFDFRMYLLQKGVPAGASGAGKLALTGSPGRGAASFFYRLRKALTERVRLIFGEESALPEALLLGERESLPEETRRGFSDAGAAHILAVSGLHVGLLAGALLGLLRRWCSPKARFFVLCGFLLFYCALLDFPAPVARAALLCGLSQLRQLTRRAPDGLTLLAAAFLLILLVSPLALFSASFLLSFSAVLGMTLFRGPLERLLSFLPWRPVREGVAVTCSATAGSLLPTVNIFHRLSLVGPFINPPLCAAFSLLLPLYALALLTGCCYLPAGQWLAVPLNVATRALVSLVQALGNLPFASLRVPSLPWYCVAGLAACALTCSRLAVLPRRKRAALACALALLPLTVWRITLCPDVQYVQLAMGQADSALILDGARTVVVDAGKRGGDLAAYLLATGRRADHLVLTHLHSDHCLGVWELLEEEIPIGAVYLPEDAEAQQVDAACRELLAELRRREIPLHFLAAGDEICTERAALRVVWPRAGTVRAGENANLYCLALLCDLDGLRLLTTGDLSGDYERYAAEQADILKVAHHGSRYSTGEEFLRRASPQIALISAGGVSESLPHPDTLARLAFLGDSVYNTGECGAVLIRIRKGEARLSTYLQEFVQNTAGAAGEETE